MTSTLWHWGILLVLLVALSAFFSGAEIGMMSINRYKLRHLMKHGHRAANRVNAMIARPERLLTVLLIGNTVANIVASTIATLIGQQIYGDVGVAVATVMLSFVILVFAELLPKTIAAAMPERVAFFCVLPLKAIQMLLLPLVYAVSSMANAMMRMLGLKTGHAERDMLTSDELRTVMLEAQGMLHSSHHSMLMALLDLEQATVEDIMIPKSEINGIDLDKPWHEILDELTGVEHTRLVLYRGSIEHVLGMIHVRTILHLHFEDNLSVERILAEVEPPYFIPESTSLHQQLHQFQKLKKRNGFVVDEYGNLIGLVTMADILEEVIGEFTTDAADYSRDIVGQDDGSYIIDASITLRELKRHLALHFPDLGPRTLSGLIIEYLGYIPPADSCLVLNHVKMEILQVRENIIRSVRILP